MKPRGKKINPEPREIAGNGDIYDAGHGYVEPPPTRVHNELLSIQGKVGDEAYHFSLAQHTEATRYATSTLNGLLKASDWVDFDSKADDAAVVHIAGAETITGLKTVDAIRFNPLPTVPTLTTGLTYWDVDDKTPATVLDAVAGVTYQYGQELYTPRCVNKTGSIIPDGKAVYVNDAQSNRPTITLAKADSLTTSCVIGITTQAIGINDEGFVTTFGLVRGFDTSTLTEGDDLYLSATTAGELTKTIPASPNCVVWLAKVLNSTVNGSIFVHPARALAADVALAANSDCVSPTQKAVKAYVDALGPLLPPSIRHEHTGFADCDDVIVTYDSSARTITLTGTVSAYFENELITSIVSGWVSDPHDATTGHTYWLHYDSTGFHWVTDDYPGFATTHIAFVNYGASNKFAVRECHGFMPFECHENDHYTIGTWRQSGGTLSGVTLDSTTAAERRPGVAATTLHDEDLETVNPLLADNGPYTQVYLTSTGVITFAVDAADIIPLSTANPYYNSFSAPNWGQTLLPANSVATVWLMAIPATADAGSQKYRYVWIQPQWFTRATGAGAPALATAAAAEALRSPGELNLGDLTFAATEFVIIARVQLKYVGGDWSLTVVTNLSGSKSSLVGSPSGNYLSTVNTTAPITGTGTATDPVLMAAATALVDGYMTSTQAGKVALINPTASKTLSWTASVAFAGTDSTTHTLPSTSSTLARIDTGQTLNGQHIFNNTASANASILVYGYGNAIQSQYNGEILLGSTAAYRGRIMMDAYTGTTCLYIDNTYNNAAAAIKLRTRTAGTPVDCLTLNSTTATFGTDIDLVSTKVYKVNNIQVLGVQGAAVADATGAGDVVAQLNALLARCRTHGIIAT